MLEKGNEIKVCYSSGHNRIELASQVVSVSPLQVKLASGDSSMLKGRQGERVIVDLRDLTSNETLMTAAVEQVLPSGVLQIKQLGEEEMREFVRVFAWLEMSHEVLEDGMAEVGLEEMVDPDFGEPLPEMTHLQMKSLARSEEASEAVLYLIQAVQALDRKLEAVSILTKQLIDRTRSGSMARRKVSISGSGLLFFDDAAYDLGAKLSLRIRLPLRRPVQLHAVAEVVRVDKEIDPELNEPRYGIACKFTNIRESDRERVIGFSIQKQREALRRLKTKGDRY